MGSTAQWAENLLLLLESGEASCVIDGACVWVSDLLSNPYFAALLATGWLWLTGWLASSKQQRGAVVQLTVKSSVSRVALGCHPWSMTSSWVISKLWFSLLSDADNCAFHGDCSCPQRRAGGKCSTQPQAGRLLRRSQLFLTPVKHHPGMLMQHKPWWEGPHAPSQEVSLSHKYLTGRALHRSWGSPWSRTLKRLLRMLC